MRCLLLLLVLCLTFAPHAHAEPGARLQVRTPEHSGLCAAVRVRFAEEATVECGPADDPRREREADLTAWLTHPDAHGERTLRARDANGRLREQALGDARGPALERAVALKLGEWWERPLPPPPPTADSGPEPAPPQPTTFITGALGGTASGPVGDSVVQPALWAHVGAGLRLRADWRLELGPAFQLAWPVEGSAPERSLRVRDRAVGAWMLLSVPMGTLHVGPFAQLLAHRIDARARFAQSRDRERRTLWAAGAGVALQLPIASHLHVQAHTGVETYARHQRYAVAGRPVLDLGRTRLFGGLSLVVRWQTAGESFR